MSDHPLQDAATRPSSNAPHLVGLVLLVAGVVGLVLGLPLPGVLMAFAGGLLLFVAARRRR